MTADGNGRGPQTPAAPRTNPPLSVSARVEDSAAFREWQQAWRRRLAAARRLPPLDHIEGSDLARRDPLLAYLRDMA